MHNKDDEDAEQVARGLDILLLFANQAHVDVNIHAEHDILYAGFDGNAEGGTEAPFMLRRGWHWDSGNECWGFFA